MERKDAVRIFLFKVDGWVLVLVAMRRQEFADLVSVPEDVLGVFEIPMLFYRSTGWLCNSK